MRDGEGPHLNILSDVSSHGQPDQCIKGKCFSECVQHEQSASAELGGRFFTDFSCDLPVILYVLFYCTGGQQGLYLRLSTLVKEFPWSSAW